MSGTACRWELLLLAVVVAHACATPADDILEKTVYGVCNHSWAQLTPADLQAREATLEQQRKQFNIAFDDELQQPMRVTHPNSTIQGAIDAQQNPTWATYYYGNAKFGYGVRQSILDADEDDAISNFGEYQQIADFFQSSYLSSPYVQQRPWRASTTANPELDKNDRWNDDAVFSASQLAGLNPGRIARVGSRALPVDTVASVLNHAFNWNRAVRKQSGYTLQQALVKKRLYAVYHPSLANLVCDPTAPNSAYAGHKYPAPLVIFVLPRGKVLLRVVAIQIGYEGRASPVYTPYESSYFWWTYAKLIAKNAMMIEAQFHAHLHDAHLVGSRLSIAAHRELPPDHPVRLLLQYHIKDAQESTSLSIAPLLGRTGAAALQSTLGYSGGLEFEADAYRQWNYRKMNLEADARDRGVANLPYYPYYEDGRMLREILREYVDGFIRLYYCSDVQVGDDVVLQAYISYIATDVHQEAKGFPTHFGSIGELVDYLTNQLWVFTGYHSALNYPVVEFNPVQMHPLTILTRVDQVDEPSAAQTTPLNQDYFLSVIGDLPLAAEKERLAFALAGLKPVQLIEDTQNGPAPQVTCVIKTKLAAMEMELEERNADRKEDGLLPYRYLLPSEVTGAISI